jgi:hypothetical protein
MKGLQSKENNMKENKIKENTKVGPEASPIDVVEYFKRKVRELEVMRILKGSGNFQVVFRSAASHSPFDIVAISKSKVLLLQVKTGKFNFKRELNVYINARKASVTIIYLICLDRCNRHLHG